VAPRGIQIPTGNLSTGDLQAHYAIQYLRGNDYGLLALANRHRFGIGGAEPLCPIAALYYKMAAEQAVLEINAPDAAQIEFVRLSVETEKSSAFNGHRGEDDEVVKYHQQLADAGNPNAQAWLGHRYYWGAGGVPRDRHRAFNYLERAANAGNLEAQYNLGVMHAYGHGIERDRERSMELFRQAADNGYVAAQNGLAVSLTDGSKDNNFTEAFLYFERSAKANNADGLYNAALLLKDGKGVERDDVRSVEYLKRAAGQDHVPARIALGGMFMDGRGVEQHDCNQAVTHFKVAAERGRSGRLLRDGLEAYLEGDIDKALMYYETAAELGYEVAQSNAAWLYMNKCPSEACHVTAERAQDMAVKWLRLASDNGNHDARRMVGDALWYGNAADPQNIVGAIEQYRIAANGGDLQSAFNLAYATYYGIGTKRDNAAGVGIARDAYKSASQNGSPDMYPNLLLLVYLQTEWDVQEFVLQFKMRSHMYFRHVYSGWLDILLMAGGKRAKLFFESHIPEILLTFTFLNIVLIQSLCVLLSRMIRRR